MKKQDNKRNVDETKNYKRISNGEVLSGAQVNYLLALANPAMQAIILLDINPTNEPVNNTLVKR